MDSSLAAPLLAALAAGGIFLFFFGIYASLAAVPGVEDRLRRYGAQSPRAGSSGGASLRLRPPSGSAIGGRIGQRLAKGRFGDRLSRDLARADVRMTASEFMTVNALATLIAAVVGFVLLHGALGAILLAIVGYFAPRVWLAFMRARRIKAFNNQLPDAIGLLANSMRSGYSFPQAMDLLARDGRPPISVEFTRVNREMGLGLPPQEAFANLLERVPSEDLDLMITAINIQRDVGGNLAEVLDSIADTIRERIKLFGEIKVLTAQQSISGYVISGLPIALGAGLFLLNPKYVSVMFTSMCGWVMLTCAGIGIVSGFLVMKKITDIKV